MSKKKGDYQIPFDQKGNQQDYPASWWKGSYPNARKVGPNWVDNFEFDDTLTLIDYGRGRSSVTFTMQKKDGKTVSVFVSDFCDMAKSSEFKAGVIAGRFTFTKKGCNYGCRLIGATP